MTESKNDLTNEEQETLLQTLSARFEKNMHRHETLEWKKVEARLMASPDKLWSLSEMERTEGEPDVVGYDAETEHFLFLIARRKALKAAEVFAMIVKRWKLEKNINLKTVQWIWQRRWELKC